MDCQLNRLQTYPPTKLRENCHPHRPKSFIEAVFFTLLPCFYLFWFDICVGMFSCFCHIALYTCRTIDSLLPMIASTRPREMTFVPNGNDDDVIINYITDMDLGEDSDSRSYMPSPAFSGRCALGERLALETIAYCCLSSVIPSQHSYSMIHPYSITHSNTHNYSIPSHLRCDADHIAKFALLRCLWAL